MDLSEWNDFDYVQTLDNDRNRTNHQRAVHVGH